MTFHRMHIGVLRWGIVAFGLVLGLLFVMPQPTFASGTCYSQSDGNWSAISWWCSNPGGVRALQTDDDIRIQHAVTLDVDAEVRGVNIESGKTFNNGSKTLTANGGYLTNDGTYTGSSGAYKFTATGGVYGNNAVTFNDVAISAGVNFFGASNRATVNGVLTINSGGWVDTNPPNYGTSSTLKYNSGGPYGINKEWASGTSGAGVPMNVEIGNGTTLDMNAAGNARTARGNVTVAGTLSLGTDSGEDLYIGGNWTRSGTFTPNSREVIFNGSTAQTINSATTWDYLHVNNSSGVTLGAAQTINNRLRFTAGRLTLSSYDLTMGSAAEAISGVSSSIFVVADGSGQLCKTYSTTGSYDFAIGDNTGTAEYSPVTLNVTGGSGSACFKVTNAAHPNKPGGATSYIDRYWTASGSGITGYDATFTFVDADKHGTSAMSGKKWTGAYPFATLGAVSGTQFASGSQTSFSDFTAFDTPLSAPLASLEAAAAPGRVQLDWETATETNMAGFNIYRADAAGGEWTRLNAAMIPSQAPGSPFGYSYRYSDASAARGASYVYRVAAVGLDGGETPLDSVSVTMPFGWLWLPIAQ